MNKILIMIFVMVSFINNFSLSVDARGRGGKSPTKCHNVRAHTRKITTVGKNGVKRTRIIHVRAHKSK